MIKSRGAKTDSWETTFLRKTKSRKNNQKKIMSFFTCRHYLAHYVNFTLFHLYIYSPDSQESDRSALTSQPASGDPKTQDIAI